MSEELKPCPFCGSEDVVLQESIIYPGEYYVCCNVCGILTNRYSNRSLAISAWNKRVENKEA